MLIDRIMRVLNKGFGKARNFFDGVMATVDAREDTDKLLSYYTKQQVKFLDRKLGITYYILCFMIAFYIVGYMFVYKKGYLELEQAKGAVLTHASGDALASSSGKAGTRYFSAEELTYPGLENGNVFVATRQTVHKQKRGVCEDHNIPCLADSDCTSWGKGTCSPNGFCVEPSWCDQEQNEVYELDTGHLQIWTRSTIQFIKIAPDRVYSSDNNDPDPKRGSSVFSVRELLLLCEPLPVRYEEVAELGAVIEVQFAWDCNVKSKKECIPTVQARRLDTTFDPENIGFGFSYPEYIDADNRYNNEMRGVRIFFRTTGVGKKVSVSATVNKASLGAALFAIGQIIADLLMTRAFKLRKKYQARKYETTQDFSEYMEVLEEKKLKEVKPAQIEEGERLVMQQEAEWMHHLQESEE